MKVLDLFSGIGGFSLGLERAGMETVAFCEFEDHARKVLKKHWPDVPIFEDVRTLDATKFRGSVDVVCGGFPCQDLSNAGRKAGISGERSGLYREMLRVISECLPRYAIFENVSALLSGDGGRWFAQFLYDLAAIGYDAEWHCISASQLGAHHHRDRVWVIAYNNGELLRNKQESEQGSEGAAIASNDGKTESLAYPNNNGQTATKERESAAKREEYNKKGSKSAKQSKGRGSPCKREDVGDTSSERQQRQGESFKSERPEKAKNWKASIFESISLYGEWATEPELGRVANGIPDRMDRLTRLGNTVVPQIPEIIGRAIIKSESAN